MKTKKEMIKEFREKFPKQYVHTKELEDWLWAEKKDIETFWLSKLEAQKQELLEKIEKSKNQFKDGYYIFHFTYTSNTGKRIAEVNKVNEPLPPDMAYQLAKKHISEFPESVMDWFVENRGVIHILEDIKQLLKH